MTHVSCSAPPPPGSGPSRVRACKHVHVWGPRCRALPLSLTNEEAWRQAMLLTVAGERFGVEYNAPVVDKVRPRAALAWAAGIGRHAGMHTPRPFLHR